MSGKFIVICEKGGQVGSQRRTRCPRKRREHENAVRAFLVGEAQSIGEHQTAVLYTPTWRDDLVFGHPGPRDFEFAIDLDEFGRRLGGDTGTDTVLLLRLHNMVMDRLEIAAGSPTRPAVRDVCGHADIRDLYLAADLMVTDYSSTMFDFAVTGKPQLFYTYDLEDYRDRLRGFYFDLEQVAPGPLVRTSDELIGAIADLDAVRARFADRYAAFRRTFCCLDDGHATDRVLDLLFPPGATPGGPAPVTTSGRA